MTSGDPAGTNGWARFPGPLASIALVGVVVAVVNASSDILEMRRADLPFELWEPLLWEFSSAAIIIALAPLVGRALRRWPPRPDNLVRFGLIHFALTIPFSLAHIAAIYVTRTAVYWLVGGHYGFFDQGVAITLLYEWRKDVLTYAAIGAFYWVFDYFGARRAAASEPASERIEIRDGAAAVFLAPADILFVEAAGNYVEFHTSARTHLVRGTLAAWEGQLGGRGFVRAHRSRLVNRARIAALKPTPAGDLEIILDNGRTLAGSRRYRAGLERRDAGLAP